MRRLLSAVLAGAFLCGRPSLAAQFAKEQVLSLRPTQIALGMMEVGARLDRLKSMKGSELVDYLAKHPVPVVLAPKGRLYMVDHHHLARAAWELGIQKLPVEREKDLSGLSLPKFWDAMRKSHWVYLYDQYGKGPHDPAVLPTDIRGLADDPYRSLSWRVRREGGYDKVDVPFSEFKWADFFRKNLKFDSVNDNFEEAVREALKLAASPEASGLPGYRGRLKP